MVVIRYFYFIVFYLFSLQTRQPYVLENPNKEKVVQLNFILIFVPNREHLKNKMYSCILEQVCYRMGWYAVIKGKHTILVLYINL